MDDFDVVSGIEFQRREGGHPDSKNGESLDHGRASGTLDNGVSKLRKEQLYVKREKCSFARGKVSSSRVILWNTENPYGHGKGAGDPRVDDPNQMKQLRSFLGLANYYRRFVEGYSRRATPMLLKKGVTWTWSEKCEEAFRSPKEAMVEDPVLAPPDVCKPLKYGSTRRLCFRRGTRAEGHPVAFESRKLSEAEGGTAQEKELLAVIH
ncbi:uncharacterized mitochondrial protein AtMg00860-like [Cannabis sativa]|uniref:uncharacterized mitochondrial protein AtMg00860-like n=1 Tax=Cannabis sativa TaxID=3483 RepID=UPI0029CA9448|nr:uncharacterized mitochondrial protein AtMg00860-like [Cannabis sativa]